MKSVSQWFLRLSVLYLIAGVSLGIFMAASHDHSMHPVHAHLNLLGWVTMALFGLFYRAWPEAAASRLAKAHFWLYVPAHFVQMVALAALFRGYTGVEPLLAAVSSMVGIAILVFAYTAWKYTGAAEQRRAAAAAAA